MTVANFRAEMTRRSRCAVLSNFLLLSFALINFTVASFLEISRPATKWQGGRLGSSRSSFSVRRRGRGAKDRVVTLGRVGENAAWASLKDPSSLYIVSSLQPLSASSLQDESVEFWEGDDEDEDEEDDTSVVAGSNQSRSKRQQGSPSSENGRSKRGIWIVIVDDEESIRVSVSQILQLNYPTARIQACSNAAEVLDLLEQQSSRSPGDARDDRDKDSLLGWQSAATLPDVIIADVRMPGMSGLDLCEAMRSPLSSSPPDVSSPWSSIPVILLTAKSALQDRLDGYRVGADAYLTKPFDPDELLALVDSVVERSNALAARDQGGAATQPLSVQDLQRELRDIKTMLLNGGGAGPGVNGFVERTGVFFPPDERQVLELLCQGKTNPEIASEMFLSRRRVEQLLTSMYRKASVKNRTELVRWAISTGQVQI